MQASLTCSPTLMLLRNVRLALACTLSATLHQILILNRARALITTPETLLLVTGGADADGVHKTGDPRP